MFRVNHEPEEKEMIGVSPVKSRVEIIPHASYRVAKDISRNPTMARLVLFLDKFGVSYQAELERALGIDQRTIHYKMKKLAQIGLVNIIRQDDQSKPSIDKRMVYYVLPKWKERSAFIAELQKWFEYEQLKTLEKALPTYKWFKIEELKANGEFVCKARYWGLNFENAIKLLANSGVFWTDIKRSSRGRYEEEEEVEVIAIKRAFDNYSRPINRDQTEPPPKTTAKQPTKREEEEVSEEEAIEEDLIEEFG